MKSVWLAAVFLVLCARCPGSDDAPGNSSDIDLGTRLDRTAASFQGNRLFTGSVLVARHGRILLDRGYGMANLEWNIPNAPDTRFRLGSLTKQFTAAAILQLAERHRLSVQDFGCRYIEGCPDAWKKVTIHQLLTHTSGIPSYTDDGSFWKPSTARVPHTPGDIMLYTKDRPMNFPPGTDWKYNNTGYTMLGMIIERVSGERYSFYMKNHIFAPLRLNATGYDDTATLLPHRASGYQPCGAAMCNADYIDMSIPYSAGGLYSTVDDLYRWDRALYTDRVLSQASRDEMFTPAQRDYGYGWLIHPMANHRQYGHGGSIPGFSTYMARFPQDNAVIIVLANNGAANAAQVAESLAATLFGTAQR